MTNLLTFSFSAGAPLGSAGLLPTRVEVSGDGKFVATINIGGYGWLYDAQSGKPLRPLTTFGLRTRTVKVVSFSPDSKSLIWIASHPADGSIDHSPDQDELVDEITFVCALPAIDLVDSTRIIIPSKNYRFRCADQGIIWAQDSSTAAIWSSSIPDEWAGSQHTDFIETAGTPFSETQQQRPNQCLLGGPYEAVALSKDGNDLLTLDFCASDFNLSNPQDITSGSHGRGFMIRRWREGCLLSCVSACWDDAYISAMFSPDATRAAILSQDRLKVVDTEGELLYDVDIPLCAAPLRPRELGFSNSMRFSGNGRFIAFAPKDRYFVLVYDVDEKKPSGQLTLPAEDYLAFALSYTGSHITILRSRNIEVWRLAGWDHAGNRTNHEPDNDSIDVVASSSDGQVIVSQGFSRVITVRDRTHGMPLKSWTANAKVGAMAVSHDKKRLALAFVEDKRREYSRRLQICDMTTGTVLVDSITAFWSGIIMV